MEGEFPTRPFSSSTSQYQFSPSPQLPFAAPDLGGDHKIRPSPAIVSNDRHRRPNHGKGIFYTGVCGLICGFMPPGSQHGIEGR